MNDIIKIIKSLEYSNGLIDGITEAVKHEIMLAPLTASLVQPELSPVVKGINGKGIRKAGRGYMSKNF